MPRAPLRWLLLVPMVALLSLGAIALGQYVERSVRQDLIAGVDSELVRAFGVGAAPIGRGPQGAPSPPGETQPTGAEIPLEFLVSDEGVIAIRLPEEIAFDLTALADFRATVGNRTIDGTPRYRIATVPEPGPTGRTRVVALSLERVDQSLASLRRNLLIGGIALLAMQALAIWFIAGAVARPVTRMSRLAHDIARGDLDADVGAPAGSRETADLATDLRHMLDRLKSTLAEKERSAADANQARTDMERFMADASHELRTPLTALKGYSDLHRGGMLDEAGLERAMDRIGSESQRLTDLVVGLLDLTKDEQRPVIEPVDLHEIVAEVIDDVSAAHPERTVSFTKDSCTIAPFVSGDPGRLHQAILNLVANACQHTPVDTAVEIVLTISHTEVEVAVVDHGQGVNMETSEALFVAFARNDASRSRKNHDGAGLGLALARRIAQQHDGTAWVRDTPGGGATFGLTLPLAALEN